MEEKQVQRIRKPSKHRPRCPFEILGKSVCIYGPRSRLHRVFLFILYD